jgi:hypothetical protein
MVHHDASEAPFEERIGLELRPNGKHVAADSLV